MARIARIYPALLLVLLLTVLVIGPAFTSLAGADYARSGATWSYVPRNLIFRFQYELPGVFASNPYPSAINGSLWTLFYEVFCYAMVVLLGFAGLLRARTVPLVLAALVAVVLVVPQKGFGLLTGASVLALPFALGAAAYVYRDRVPVSLAGMIALGGLAALCAQTPLHPVTYPLALSSFALWFGFAEIPFVAWYRRLGDPSYGMYIYAFPIEQILAATMPGIEPARLIAIALPLTLGCAVLSWRFVEEPALARRHALAASVQRLLGNRRTRLAKAPPARR